MRNKHLIVVDWTHGDVRVGVFTEGRRGLQPESEIILPARLAVRREEAGGLSVLAGEEALSAREDARTFVFEQPAHDLPRTEDAELQTLLLSGFWHALEQSLLERGLLQAGAQAAGYVVTPHRFPTALLENFRASCAGERPLRLVGFVHEAAALALGFLRSEAFRPEVFAAQSSAHVNVCLVAAVNEQNVNVACFDYAPESPARHRVLIHDFFQTTCAELSTRLHDCDWLGTFSLLVTVEDPALPAPVREALDAPLQAISGGIRRERWQILVARLKLAGGAHLAQCASGRTPDEQEYDLAHVCHVGVQVDQQHFQPVIRKDEWAELTEFPHLAAQAFRLRGQPGNALRLNLCCGYSTRVADATPLGHMTLWQSDLAELSAANALTAAIRLDAPCAGEFLLGLMPENRVLRRQPFTLPCLIA